LSKNLGKTGRKPEHKAARVKAYLTHRTWLLKVSKKDAERLGLEPFESYEIYLSKEGSDQ
jgi:hypothetical protein